ncbi:MAG: glycosyltransferase [Rhizobiaceae bacterium]|nr:glycosyltransferase [Rhizobiaceae bacterium]MCZ8352528.1 glycosyltransferase [Rhizobium sp.]
MSSFTLHIFLTSAGNESRLYKEAAYTISAGICRRVLLIGLWKDGLATDEITDFGLEIYRHPTMIARYSKARVLRQFGILRNVLLMWSLLQYALACIGRARQLRPDHVSCHNAVALPIAWAASRFSGATLEYLPHELETQRTGLSGLQKRLTSIVERCFIRSARNVVVVCAPIRDWYSTTYKLRNLHVVRNVPEREAVASRPIPNGGFRQRFEIPDSARIFIYQGLFSAGRGIEILLEVFATLNPERCHLVLMGYGEDGYESLIQQATIRHTNIHHQPAVPREWIVSYSASADVGVFVSESASVSYRYSLPNKFFEWAHAGLPIIVSDNLGYQAQLLHDGGFGWAVPLSDLTAAIERISEADLAPAVANARRYALDAVWDEEAKIFAKIYRPRTAKGSTV